MYKGKKKGYGKAKKGGGKVKKEFRDSFLKKITFCSKHFDLNDDTHDVKEKADR